MKTIIIGLGNPILGDDGVGWRVVEALKERVEAQGVETDMLASGGIGLMERLVGYERAIIVDAIATGSFPTGSVRVFPLEALENSFAGHLGSAHESNLQTALQVGRDLGASLPDQVPSSPSNRPMCTISPTSSAPPWREPSQPLFKP